MTPPTLTQMRYRMGTLFEIRLWADSPAQAHPAIEEAFEEIRLTERCLSRFDPESEVSHLHRQAGRRPVRVSQRLWNMVTLAGELSRQTDGAFDITTGGFSRLWEKAHRRQRLPDREALRKVKAETGWEKIRTDAPSRTVRFHHPNLALDFGGIGKGYALDLAVVRLQQRGIDRGLVDAGGNFRTFGFEEPVRFGIEHPLLPDRLWATADLIHPAVASSSNRLRTRSIQGKSYGHIVNPRSGWSLADDAGTTVLAESAALADACSTALLVLGPRGLSRLQALRAEGMLLRGQGSAGGVQVWTTAGLGHHITPLNPTEVHR